MTDVERIRVLTRLIQKKQDEIDVLVRERGKLRHLCPHERTHVAMEESFPDDRGMTTRVTSYDCDDCGMMVRRTTTVAAK
jgi:hypothetical protein